MADNDKLKAFYQYVQEKGKLRTEQHARRWATGILKTLGVNLDRGTKKRLAEALPDELADDLTRVFYLLNFRDPELTSYEFQRLAARRSGNTDAEFARYPVLAVFGGLKQIIGSDLDREVAETLAPELRTLWQEAGSDGTR